MAEPIMKIIREPGQGGINNLESELAIRAAKIKNKKILLKTDTTTDS